MTTNYPALPAEATHVDIVLPGVGEARRVPVTRAVDAAAMTGAAVAADSGRWTYWIEDPPRGWSTQEWPTPVPASRQLRDYVSTVDVALPAP
jgi:hypothetical protein